MKFCPECGSKLRGSEKFCPECGFNLAKLLAATGGLPTHHGDARSGDTAMPSPVPAAQEGGHTMGGELLDLLRQGSEALQRGELQEALSSFERILAREPGNIEAMVGKGEVLLALGHFTEAITLGESAVRSEPENERALYLCAEAYFRLAESRQSMRTGGDNR